MAAKGNEKQPEGAVRGAKWAHVEPTAGECVEHVRMVEVERAKVPVAQLVVLTHLELLGGVVPRVERERELLLRLPKETERILRHRNESEGVGLHGWRVRETSFAGCE